MRTCLTFLFTALVAGLAGCSTRGACCAPCSPCAAPRAPYAVATAPATPAAAPVAVRATPTAVGGPADYDAILRRYVRGDYFDYAGLAANPADRARLDAFMRWQATANPKSMSREDRIAFYINAYNSANIQAILDNYPVHSPMDVPGYFDKLTYRVAGEDLTLGQIEYDRLIADHLDMRAHFAVVCSDRGCLPLRGEAWKGSTLDEDLDAAARRFVKDERHFKVDFEKREVWISKIFEWYGEKFTKDPDRPAAKPELFLLPYVDAKTRELLESGSYTVKIIEWNWTLNEKGGKS